MTAPPAAGSFEALMPLRPRGADVDRSEVVLPPRGGANARRKPPVV